MPLRARLALAVVLATAVVCAVGGYLFVRELRIGLYRSLDGDLRQHLSDAASEVQDSAVPPGSPRFSLPDEIPIGQILGPDGRVVASTRAAGATALLPPPQLDDPHRLGRAVTVHDGSTRVMATALSAGSSQMFLVAGVPLKVTTAAVDRVQAQVTLTGLVLVLIAGGAGWVIAGAALRPVERLRRQVAALEADELADVEVAVRRDELGRLARTMNDMLRRVRGARRREQAFIAEASHELRTPLAILRGELELAARPGRTRDELAAAVTVASGETDRISRLAEDLLLLARTDSGALPLRVASMDPLALIEESVRRCSGGAGAVGVRLVVEGDETLRVIADADRLRQAVDNLLVNAIKYAPPESVVTVSVGTSGERWWLTVSDDGPGFDDAILDRAFEPFAKGRQPSRRSTPEAAGLGLAVVAAIAKAHHGAVSASNLPGGGAAVRLELPAQPSGSA